jgi:hypothetical protein
MISDEPGYLGTPIPLYNLAFSANFKFLRYFTFSVLFESAMGHSVSNQTRSIQVSYGNVKEYNDLQTQLFGDNSDPDNPIAPLYEPGTAGYKGLAEKYAKMDPNWAANYIEPADWFRIRDISFRIDAYEFLKDFIGNPYVKEINFVASVHNAALWSDYHGIDPQVHFDGSRTSVSRGIDFITMPSPRTYNFQVNIGF